MSKAKLQAATMGGSADEVEAAFYEALQTGDIDKLMACWADEDDIVCVHPGGPRVVGTGAVQAAFTAVFASGSIRAWPHSVRKVQALASCVHSVLERIEVLTQEGLREAYVIATNVYHKTPQGWRMVAHHASPGTAAELLALAETPQMLH
jgi:ketosteroid isomerase-like protein